MNADLPVQMLNPSKAREGVGACPKRDMTVRLPVVLIDRLDAFAAAGFRSRSAEIAMRLQASFAGEVINAHGVIVSSALPLKSDQTPRGHICP